MPPKIEKTMRAMFDVKPVAKTGHLDFEKLKQVEQLINLKNKSQVLEVSAPEAIRGFGNNFDRVLNIGIKDPRIELLNLGGFVNFQSQTDGVPRKQKNTLPHPLKPKRIIMAVSRVNDPVLDGALSEISKPIGKSLDNTPVVHTDNNDKKQDFGKKDEVSFQANHEIDQILKNLDSVKTPETEEKPSHVDIKDEMGDRSSEEVVPPIVVVKPKPKKKGWSKFFIILILASALTGFSVYATSYGFSVKNSATEDGTAALQNLEQAGEDLKVFDFENASTNFKEAYQYFTQAGESLNIAGATVSGLLSELPGAEKLRSAKNLVEIGKLMASSGQAMAEAVSALSKTGAVLNKNKTSGFSSSIFNDLIEALSLSQININKARALISDVDASVIPPDKEDVFAEFKSQLPVMAESLDDSLEYTRFFERLIGSDKPRRYLVLFQNNTELRPAGGFPGTYGVITFENGMLKDFKVDDIYNLDAVQPRNFIPPKQLQHITPTWGMRDSAWFIDFPTSAQKVKWFYKQATGEDVDGVITLTPAIVAQILDLVGPVAMSEYGVTLNGENFIAEIQAEVEYGPNRTQPKQIVKDLAPELLERIYLSSGETWLEIFNAILAGLDRKDVLMYFDDLNLKNFVVEHGFSGEIENAGGDYLMVSLANIKGSKTDRYTDTKFNLDTQIKDYGVVRHQLTITRTHNGGDKDYGFYNKQNPAYVRVLVPKGAKLISISGNDKPNYRALVGYDNSFVTDEELFQLEGDMKFDQTNSVWSYKEGDREGFAFWQIVDPKSTSIVNLVYEVSLSDEDNYQLYVQKQPGIIANFDAKLESSKPAISASSGLNKIGNSFHFEGSLDRDVIFGLGF